MTNDEARMNDKTPNGGASVVSAVLSGFL